MAIHEFAALALLVLCLSTPLRALPKRHHSDVQRMPLEHLQMHKQALLNKMGLDSAPTPTGKSSIPPVMYRLYYQMLRKPTCSNKMYRVVRAGVVKIESSKQQLEFILPTNKVPTPLLLAEIRVPTQFANSSVMNLTYEDRTYQNGPAITMVRLEDGSVETGDHEMVWDVTDIVRKSQEGLQERSLQFWLSSSQQFSGQAYMLVTSESNAKCPSENDLSTNDVDLDQTKDRIKREAQEPGPRQSRQSRQCRRKHLFVDFQDIHWDDWIISPSGYRAYYCEGKCPFPMGSHLNSTNHAIIQTLISGTVKARVPPACCVPTKLKPVTMLYLDSSNEVVLREYSNMAVEECGCL